MRYHRIPEHTKTLSIARPRYLEAEGDTAVLVLHGFKGITDNMTILTEHLHAEGYTVSTPRLPGHGTNHIDFHLTGWRDWLRRSIDAYLDLRGSHGHVYLAGLSMGGVLALILASMFEVEKMALCAPGLKASNPLVPLSPLLRFLVPRLSSGYEEESPDPERHVLADEYWGVHTAYSVSQLYRLQRYAKRRLSKVTADTIILVSAADRTVPASVADLIEDRISSARTRRVVLERSSHVLTEGVEKDRVTEEIVRWFAQPET